ncbi:MAG: KOW domain-containing RNA-binding protein [Oscillospiraceae bacterium]|nr:KOW domain-containing RNA-binding protein [Oscillospiraceae bacterium]
MSIEKANVVIPINGRDAGKRFIVVGTEDDYSLLADGKGRRVEKPKRKKNKHVQVEDKIDGLIATKLSEGERVTNSEIRRALAMPLTRGDKGGM